LFLFQAFPLGVFSKDILEEELSIRRDDFLSNVRQVTFEGKRSGEGYFSPDGARMVFQSERDSSNPFYQIFLMDLTTGSTEKISTGIGKTTCGWIRPDGTVLYASTHADSESERKQKEELDVRARGKSRRYQWDYDEKFDLYLLDLEKSIPRRLTWALGYDAEGSSSPDGSKVVFSSNRHAYEDALTLHQKKLFETDKSFMLDLYLLEIEGGQIERLTSAPGYDGGPFFSPSGNKICFRRFSEDGKKAEIFTIFRDGSDERQLTSLDAMSWSPFFHPSGRYLIFTTNLHGFSNFELYLIDTEGQKTPVRVTWNKGFDGLPVFSPDGHRLAWTRTSASGSSQIFFGDWDHKRALMFLHGSNTSSEKIKQTVLSSEIDKTSGPILSSDLKRHVEFLASDELEGRMTGSMGEEKAGEYLANFFSKLGLKPAGEDGSYFQNFEFVSGVRLGIYNELRLANGTTFELNSDWRPLAFSKTGSVAPSAVVFAGYGIVAPSENSQEEYDSYVHLDVQDKWVLVFRYLPEQIGETRRQYLSRYSSLRYKAMVARDRGAAGILIVSGPNSGVEKDLIGLGLDASSTASDIVALSLRDSVAKKLLGKSDYQLKMLQDQLDTGESIMGFPITGLKLEAKTEIVKEKRIARNVIACLPSFGAQAPGGPLLVGAHMDHLGRGLGGNSLARRKEHGQIHNGADDNASGTAALLEIAQYLVAQKIQGKLNQKRDFLFAAWSGEELGILGSKAFVAWKSDSENSNKSRLLEGKISSYLNLDMIGRLRENLSLQGVGSSPVWLRQIEQRNVLVGLPIITVEDSYLPTDSTSFYIAGVPVLSAFTGVHEDYHSPRDTVDKLNYQGMERISRLMALIARSLGSSNDPPQYIEKERPKNQGIRGLRVYLGSIPDYIQGDVKGVKLSGVTKGGPADRAGLRAGDVVVKLASKKIENIYDYTYTIDSLKIGKETLVIVLRDGERLELKIVPGSRE